MNNAEVSDLSHTIVPKSDQLNADDLRAGPITVKIKRVSLSTSREQPVVIHIESYKPYKPCKNMRRVLITLWGKDGSKWIGQSLRLFRNPKATFQGIEVGGIRISHMTGIREAAKISLPWSRSNRSIYTVEPLVPKSYPEKDFERYLPAWRKAITEGRMTADEVIRKAQSVGELTEKQKEEIRK